MLQLTVFRYYNYYLFFNSRFRIECLKRMMKQSQSKICLLLWYCETNSSHHLEYKKKWSITLKLKLLFHKRYFQSFNQRKKHSLLLLRTNIDYSMTAYHSFKSVTLLRCKRWYWNFSYLFLCYSWAREKYVNVI